MPLYRFVVVLVAGSAALCCSGNSNAAIIYQSATLGPTGITEEQLRADEVNGSHVNDVVFIGVRFNVSATWQTSRVAAHLVDDAGGKGFGAIVKLIDASDFPDSDDLSTPDVIGVTLLDFPRISAMAYGRLEIVLKPGWYAIVFGSGLFDANGDGASVNNGVDLDSPSYIGWQPGGQPTWFEPTAFHGNKQFLVEGELVPEPTAAALLLTAVPAIIRRGRTCP